MVREILEVAEQYSNIRIALCLGRTGGLEFIGYIDREYIEE